MEGLILEAPRGTGGFGYDPLFYLPELDETMAEIDLETKLSLSHRGRAIAALLPCCSAEIRTSLVAKSQSRSRSELDASDAGTRIMHEVTLRDTLSLNLEQPRSAAS